VNLNTYEKTGCAQYRNKTRILRFAQSLHCQSHSYGARDAHSSFAHVSGEGRGGCYSYSRWSCTIGFINSIRHLTPGMRIFNSFGTSSNFLRRSENRISRWSLYFPTGSRAKLTKKLSSSKKIRLIFLSWNSFCFFAKKNFRLLGL